MGPAGGRAVFPVENHEFSVGTRDEHGPGLKPILSGPGLDRTAIFLKIGGQDWIGLRKFLLFYCDYSENIKNFGCNPISQVCYMAVYILLSNAKTLLGLFCNFFFYLFVSRHEVHSMNTHTLLNAG